MLGEPQNERKEFRNQEGPEHHQRGTSTDDSPLANPGVVYDVTTRMPQRALVRLVRILLQVVTRCEKQGRVPARKNVVRRDPTALS